MSDTVVAQAVVVPVVPVVITKEQFVEEVAKVCEDLVVRQTTGTSYKHLGTKVDGEVNFKKGMFYEVVTNSKGLTVNMLAYSTKQGAHLVEFRPLVEKLIGDGITIGNKGLAWKLVINLPNTLGLEKMVAEFKKFHEKINPTIEAIRKQVTPQGRLPVVSVVKTPEVVAQTPAAEEVKTEEVKIEETK